MARLVSILFSMICSAVCERFALGATETALPTAFSTLSLTISVISSQRAPVHLSPAPRRSRASTRLECRQFYQLPHHESRQQARLNLEHPPVTDTVIEKRMRDQPVHALLVRSE